MIKNPAHIRKFTTEQKRQLQAIADAQDIATAKNVLHWNSTRYSRMKLPGLSGFWR